MNTSNAMIVNDEHPRYDAALELLCLLPRRIDGAGRTFHTSIADVVADLGLSDHGEVRALVKQLAARGIAVDGFRVAGCGNCLAVAPASWRAAKRMASEYFDRVYGGGASVKAA